MSVKLLFWRMTKLFYVLHLHHHPLLFVVVVVTIFFMVVVVVTNEQHSIPPPPPPPLLVTAFVIPYDCNNNHHQQRIQQQQQQQHVHEDNHMLFTTTNVPTNRLRSYYYYGAAVRVHDDDVSYINSNDNNNNNIETTSIHEIGVGIDLGTTNSAIAYLDENHIPTMISIPIRTTTITSNNKKATTTTTTTIPSIVAFFNQQQFNTTTPVPLVGHDVLNYIQNYYTSSSSVVLQEQQQQQRGGGGSGNTEEGEEVLMIYRNVKRIIGTGGKISKMISSSSSTFQSKHRGGGVVVVPYIHVNKNGKTYNKMNLQNQLYDSIYHPTLLLSPLTTQHQQQQSLSLLLQQQRQGDSISDYDNITMDNNNNYIRPEIISSYIIQTLKNITEETLSKSLLLSSTTTTSTNKITQIRVTRAVIGVPAYFNDAQRNATIRAAQLAGIEKIKLLREPEAAALAYGSCSSSNVATRNTKQQQSNDMDDNDDDDEFILVFDLGGGTYDVSIVYVSDINNGGIMEVIATSGNTELGGTTFDTKIAMYIQEQMVKEQSKNVVSTTTTRKSTKQWSQRTKNLLLLVAEEIRIYLSNHRIVHVILPLNEQDWYPIIEQDPSSVIVRIASDSNSTTSLEFEGNTTHAYISLSRKDMEMICSDELHALLRPIREVAIMAGALLPGDSSPSVVAAAMDDYDISTNQQSDRLVVEDFYAKNSLTENGMQRRDAGSTGDDNISDEMLITLNNALNKNSKKSQQLGRKRARDIAKEERKYRQEKKNIMSTTTSTARSVTQQQQIQDGTTKSKNPKVRDGISGRPLSRIVLVGGATRMPCIGRLLTAITGVVPQRTVNPDEAVALGCAIQAGIYDGQTNMGTVLTPIQAAILRATMSTSMSDLKFGDGDDDEEFDEGEVY